MGRERREVASQNLFCTKLKAQSNKFGWDLEKLLRCTWSDLHANNVANSYWMGPFTTLTNLCPWIAWQIALQAHVVAAKVLHQQFPTRVMMRWAHIKLDVTLADEKGYHPIFSHVGTFKVIIIILNIFQWNKIMYDYLFFFFLKR